MPRQQFNLKKKSTSNKNNIKISNLIIFKKKEKKLVKLIFFLFLTWRTQNIHVTSSTSSSSSILQNYRFKRAILVGKRGGSTTPVPTWRLMSSSESPASALRGALDSPKPSGLRTKHQHQNQSQKQPPPSPVSARKLVATLWEMNEIPSPSPSVRESSDERRMRKEEAIRGRERIAQSVHSGSLPPHLSNPSHSPVSEVRDLLLL